MAIEISLFRVTVVIYNRLNLALKPENCRHEIDNELILSEQRLLTQEVQYEGFHKCNLCYKSQKHYEGTKLYGTLK